MRSRRSGCLSDTFDWIASKSAHATGQARAFIAAALIILIWAATGPLFHYSDTWQLVINTSTTIVTFLMVFLIQHAQNKDTRALQLKLNELLAATEGASNRLIDIEELTDNELEHLHARYQRLVATARRYRTGKQTTVEADAAEPDDEPDS